MSRHLGDELSDYVDRRLPAPALLAWDRHVAVCEHCRYAVAEERRVLASLRSAPPPGMSSQLQAMLLQLAASGTGDEVGSPAPAARPAPTRGQFGLRLSPPVPLAPAAAAPLRLPTVAPSSPALHRSLRRAAMVAGLAAGASAAAAWTLGVAPVTASSSPSAPLVVSPAGGAPAARFPAGVGVVTMIGLAPAPAAEPARAPRGVAENALSVVARGR